MRRRRSIPVACLSLAVLLAALTSPARAQTIDASILGTVRDSAGAGLAAVTVTAHNTLTGVESTILTTATGRFAFLQLPLGGPYTITARRLGFRPSSRAGYQLTLGTRVVIDIVLGPAPAELPSVVVAGTSEERRAPSLGANFRVSS